MSIGPFLLEARPKQWLKNVLVFAGPAAAELLDSWSAIAETLLIFVGFCLTASGTYFLNDIIDVRVDRNHPIKRTRPIAAGVIQIHTALVTGIVLLVSGVIVAGFSRWEAGVIVVVYAVLTVSYSLYLKRIPLLELSVIASGFVLRAMAGAAGTDTPMSTWFILCITFGSFFVASGKRFAEVLEFGEGNGATRAGLSAYSLSYLRQLIVFACTATAISYFLWAFENASGSSSDFPFFELSIVPMVLALLRYLMVLEAGSGGAPEDVFINDPAIRYYALAWLVLYVVGVYA